MQHCLLYALQGYFTPVTSQPICTDTVGSRLPWEEWKAAVELSGAEPEASTPCQDPLCSPSAADNAQCLPGRYVLR